MNHFIRRNRGILLLFVSTMLAAVITGCMQSDDHSLDMDAQDDGKRSSLVLAVGSEPEAGFDPTTGWGRYGSPLFQSTLLKRDDELAIVKDLAAGYEISDDGLVWTIKLRPDVQFSDGQPLTAADVQYTFETASASGSVLDLQNMHSIQAIHDDLIQITLKKPQSTFINTLVATGIVPKHAHGPGYAEHPIGSGPFRFVQWDKGQQLIVEANPLYYGAKPFFQNITFLFLNEDAAFAAAKAGHVDVAYIPASLTRQEVSGMRLEAVKTVDNRGIVFPYVKSGKATSEGYAIGNDVTADPAIRRAINIAIDRQALVDGLLEGYGTPAYTIADGLPWWNPDSVIGDADMETARAILHKAGWTDRNKDGWLDKDGVKAEFTLLYPSNDMTRQSLAIAVADMIKPLGVHIRVEGKSWEDIRRLMHSQAVLMGWGSHDPIEIYNVFSSKNAGVEYYNTGFYANPVVDEYMESALAATSEAEANRYWRLAQWDGTTGFSARGDAPWAWLVNIDHLYLVNDNLDIGKQRIHPHGHGWPVTDNLEKWKWKE